MNKQRDVMTCRIFAVLFIIVQVILFASSEVKADVTNAIQIVNGKSMSFTTDLNSNWYVFTLKSSGNILLLGSDSDGLSISNVKIYDDSLAEVVDRSYVKSESFNLDVGRYYLVISDYLGGIFSAFSKEMSNPLAPNPPKGSIANPIFPENGKTLPFDGNIETNIFYFAMKFSGNLLVSGSDSDGLSISNVKIYDDSLAEVVDRSYVKSESFNLDVGKYYLVISDYLGGTFSAYSKEMTNPIVTPPSPSSNKSMPWLSLLLSPKYRLTIHLAGSGSGFISSNPEGISCGNDCTESFNNPNQKLKLMASADSGSTFVGWSGAECSGVGTCQVTVDSYKEVTANFLLNYPLTINKTGTGNGTVTSNLNGIDCGSDCSESYLEGTIVTLSAIADANSIFTCWSGAGCAGAETCQVTIDSPKVVSPIFQSNIILGSEVEQNDSSCTPNTISFDTPITGQLSSDTDQDWFIVNNDSPRTVSVDFSIPSLAGYTTSDSWTVSVYNSNDILLSQTNLEISNAPYNVALPSAGLYYFVVTPRSSYYFRTEQYQITVVSNDGATLPDAETEINDTKSTADPIVFGSPFTGQLSSDADQDWFIVNNDSPRTVSVDFSIPSLAGYTTSDSWTVSVYNSNDILLSQTNLEISNAPYNVALPSAGLYYFVVTPRSSYYFRTEQYQITISSE